MSKEYNISKSNCQCAACQKAMQPTQEYMATVHETDEDFAREDYCMECWSAKSSEGQADIVGVWRATIPQAQEKKKLFVDDELLVNFFQRLEQATEPAKINFRFVLALVLMRKKMLVYDRMLRKEDGSEVWTMHFKGSDQIHEVIDPKMDEDKIAQVSQHLGEILQGEL